MLSMHRGKGDNLIESNVIFYRATAELHATWLRNGEFPILSPISTRDVLQRPSVSSWPFT